MPTYIYHITKITNLPRIIASGGLLSKNSIQKANIEYDNIAHNSIQDQRTHTNVPCAAGGNLHDYIPFYFAPKSPMLFTIEDPDRKRRRQAEFLVHEQVHWNWILGIAVMNNDRKIEVEQMIAAQSNKPQVKCIPNWYYSLGVK